jgi:hypothetical protein
MPPMQSWGPGRSKVPDSRDTLNGSKGAGPLMSFGKVNDTYGHLRETSFSGA